MAEQAAAPDECEHAWASKHEPGHLFYWVRQCMLCHEVDWDDLDANIGRLVTVDETVPAKPNAGQLAAVLEQIAEYSSDGDIRADVRQVAKALRGDGFIILNGPPQVPSDEDRIRDAMAEAQDHPGRVVTR